MTNPISFLPPVFSRLLVGVALLGTGAAALAEDRSDEYRRVETAASVLTEIMQIPEQAVPPQLLADAEGIAIIPNLFKAGFILGGQRGQGLVMVRRADRSWSNPSFLTLTGGSIGFQIGAESNDIILVFKNRRGVEDMAQGKFTLGGDASIAAGPVGRQASASTDHRLQAEVYSYARSRGLFAGVSLEGAALQINQAANMRFYRDTEITAEKIFQMQQLPPKPADDLLSKVEFYAPAASGVDSANNQQLRRAE